MSIQTVTSKNNPNFKHTKALLSSARQRKKFGETVLEGVHLLSSYLSKGHVPKCIWVSQSAQAHLEVAPLLACCYTTVYVITDALYKDLRTLGEGVDVLAVVDQPQARLAKSHTIKTDTLVLNDIQDSGNVGTLLRTAAAVGFSHVLCTQGTCSCFSPKCLRAGMGAQFSLNIYENIPAEMLLNHLEAPLLATSSHACKVLYEHDLTAPITLVLGNEGQGICDTLMARATLLSLPQPNGEESLNVAVAGAVCMYETLRQRQYGLG